MDDIPYLKALVSSMPRRLEEVIRRDGHNNQVLACMFFNRKCKINGLINK
jgi:hypothetical protein